MKSRILMALTAGVLLLGACKGNGLKNEEINNKTAMDTVSVGPDSGTTTKLVKTADMRFKVKNVQQTGDVIATLTTKAGGTVMSHDMTAVAGDSQRICISDDSVKNVTVFTSSAEMTVKIPSNRLEEFLTEVAHLGIYTDTRKMNIEDRSLSYLAQKLKLENRKQQVKQEEQGVIKKKEPAKDLQFKDDMVDQQVANIKTDAEVKYSTLTLSFYQSNSVVQEIVANDDPSAYQQSFFKRMAMAFGSGWNMFTEVLLGIANLWVFIATGLGLWFLYKYYKKKRPGLFAGTIKS